MKEIKLNSLNAVITVHIPDLSEEERNKRMQQLKDATIFLLKKGR